MLKLTPLWRLLEVRPSGAAVWAEWQAYIGELLPVVGGLLRSTGRLATSYPRLGSGELPLRVVKHRDGSFAAICNEDDGDRMELSRAGLVLHEVDPRRLRQAIGHALPDVKVSTTPLTRLSELWPLGHWEPKPAAQFPIRVLFRPGTTALRAAIHEIDAGKGALLMTPSRSGWEETAAYARERKVMLACLDEIIEVGPNGLRAAAAWQGYLAAFTQMVGSSLPANFRNKTKPAKRASRTADIERLERAIEEHIRTARDRAFHLRQIGRPMNLLPRPDQKDLAALLGISTSRVSRCFSDSRAHRLRILFEAAESLESVLDFRR